MTDNERALEHLRDRLANHEVYASVCTKQGLRLFMEQHAVCVLDFMSLVKRLQVELTCVRVPWTPQPRAELVRFVNEIVLDEESDDDFGPMPSSHYEWYLAAMEEVGADTSPIRTLEARLRAGDDPEVALAGCELSAAAKSFASTTFELCRGPLHVVAAAFFYGREDVIPKMFLPLVQELEASDGTVSLFRRYLERHIAVDGENHGPLAARLFEELLAEAPGLRAQGLAAGRRALEARLQLWDSLCILLRGEGSASAVLEPRPHGVLSGVRSEPAPARAATKS
ncbi:MAG: hypothetical protein ACI8QZ_003330 [Chlamydiales bacterium]|jgi:hypothetical protein